ncbi:hypothetical protein ACFWOJ_02185 [Streptomyces sp. NPDC058439]
MNGIRSVWSRSTTSWTAGGFCRSLGARKSGVGVAGAVQRDVSGA